MFPSGLLLYLLLTTAFCPLIFLLVWGFPDSSVGKESACNAGNPGLIPGQEDHWGRDRLPTPVFLGFPYGSAGKESTCNVGHMGSIPGLGREGKGKIPVEGKGYPLQYK